ncbi:hypothetical protein C8J56DRAFT_1025737 [Mycena floridula]|nr:hypothetical protein C8J56DRAFT_1025737 [Mycena floridula]
MRLSTSSFFSPAASVTLIRASPKACCGALRGRGNLGYPQDHLERRMEFWLNKRAEIDSACSPKGPTDDMTKKGKKEFRAVQRKSRYPFPQPDTADYGPVMAVEKKGGSHRRRRI